MIVPAPLFFSSLLTFFFLFVVLISGTYLLSGGEEAVLVIWQMKTGNKVSPHFTLFLFHLSFLNGMLACLCPHPQQFLPRLATAITEITVSPDQSMYALCHRDGSVRIVSASTLKTLQVTNSLKYGIHLLFAHLGGLCLTDFTITGENNILSKTLGKNLVIEPRNGYAVLTGGLPGTIQFYNLKTDQRISEVSFF